MSGLSLSRGRSGAMGIGGYQPGVYLPLKALFLVKYTKDFQNFKFSALKWISL